MDLSTHKVAIAALGKLRKGNYAPFNTKVPFDEMIRLYNRLVFVDQIEPIEKLDESVKQELKDWAKEIGYGTNAIKGMNICRCLTLIDVDIEKFIPEKG